jgi:uncharacterized protein DUF3300
MRLRSKAPFLPMIAAAALFFQTMVFAQAAQDANQPIPVADTPPAVQLLTPNQLDNLVAPIALYPDPLISQIMVASTYPLELVEAYQWLQRNPGLTGTALTQAAAGQNWDPSVQVLVMFPDVMKQLNQDVAWTTNLGNAFLAQQADVMNAVQRMRLRAQQAGKLAPSPQQQVITTTEAGQPIVEILPVNPAVIYVPVYDPVWIWGPAVYYPYPRWVFPPRPAVVVFGFGPGITIGTFLGGGWGGWAGWGWRPAWSTRTVIVSNTFVHRYNFNAAHITSFTGTTVWVHETYHRHGVPYPSPVLTQRFRGPVRENLRPRELPPQVRSVVPERSAPPVARPSAALARPTPREMLRDEKASGPVETIASRNRSAFGGIENGNTTRLHIDHGYSSLGPARTSTAGLATRPAPHAAAAANRRGNRKGK